MIQLSMWIQEKFLVCLGAHSILFGYMDVATHGLDPEEIYKSLREDPCQG
jgi:hypothetical protein